MRKHKHTPCQHAKLASSCVVTPPTGFKVKLQTLTHELIKGDLKRSNPFNKSMLQIPLIQVLVALCPLLGLLGTVLGMIGVFEVIAVSGNDDAQAMARGVYRATIPTMAGLVVALSGIYFTVRLRRLADHETSRLMDSLTLHELQLEGQKL